MPKLKTHRGTAKRVRVTGGGKLVRNRSFGHHKLAKKSGSRKRLISTPSVLAGKIGKNIKRAIGA